MIKTIKVKLSPNKTQEKKFIESSHIARFAYNWGLGQCMKFYEENHSSKNVGELRKDFTQLRNQEKYNWLLQVSSEIPQQALKDVNTSFNNFYRIQKAGIKYSENTIKKAQRQKRKLTFYDLKGHPKFKKRGKCQQSFFHLGNKLKVAENKIYLEKIGWIKMNDDNRLPQGNYKKDKIVVYNPRIKFDGKYWILSIGLEFQTKPIDALIHSIGIDVGIKDLVIASNIDKPFQNINKTSQVKKIKKTLKRKQKQVSKKYELNKENNKFKKTNNIIKLEKEIKLLHRKLYNIRTNHLYQTANSIVKTKPYQIVVEDLNVKGMIKNKHLSKAIAEQKLSEFLLLLQHKCNEYGIHFVQADRFFPSSKTCSHCGSVKKDLKLSDRIYKCECGFTMDRDKNASINLANYKLS